MEDDDEDALGLVRLCTWTLSLNALTHAALSPSLQRLLLFHSSTATADVLNLTAPSHSPVSLAPITSFAWGSQQDCYGVCGVFQELLFASTDQGFVVYGFATNSDPTMSPAVEITPDLQTDVQGRPKLIFPDAESWPQMVSFLVPYASPSFSRLVNFATGGEECCSSSATMSKLFSGGNYVGMVLTIGQSSTIVISTIYDSDIRWIARINLEANEEWADFCLVFDKLFGLTRDGKLFIWEAITGAYLSLVRVSTTCAVQVVPGQGVALVGVVDRFGCIFLVSLEDHSRPWELAGSDAWFLSPSGPAPGPSAFTPKRLLASKGTLRRVTGSRKKYRQVVLPVVPSTVTAVGINSCAVSRLITTGTQMILLQSGVHADSHSVAKRAYDCGEVLGFSFQGSLYLITASFLAVVLPPFMAERDCLRKEPWWLTDHSVAFENPISVRLDNPTLSLQACKVALLDRCLVSDGLKEAEHLFVENGWSTRYVRMRSLQLALDYQRADEVGSLLDKLVAVDAAETGVLRIIFKAIELMTSHSSTDNDLALASRLLALAARFTRDLLKDRGSRKLTGIVPVRYKNAAELAQLMETIRNLQEQLYAGKNRPKHEKGEAEVVEKLEKRTYASNASTAVDELGGALVPSEEESSSTKHPSQESPKEMIARWEKENVDILGIVKDALRAGRVPLAVVQLHHRRSESSDEGTSTRAERHVFREVQDIGRSVVYELFCKGKVPLALAALRRLGEDVFTVLHELAFGTVRRSLRTLAARELRRHGRLDSRDCHLLSTVSRIEGIYPNSKFWRSYCIRRKSTAPPERLQLCFSTPAGDISVECGEVDGVVLGTWNKAAGSMEEETLREETSAAYWAGALIWFYSLDQQTIDRMLLERSEFTDATWKARLEFAVVHSSWSSLSSLISDFQSLEVQVTEAEICMGTSGNVVKIPNLKSLILDLTACSGWLWRMTECQLARSCIFLRAFWTDADEFLSLLARAGLVFCSAGDQDHLELCSSKAIFQLVVGHCVQHNLPWLMELYLDNLAAGFNKQALDIDIMGGSHWSRWLLLSLQRGSEYNASFANARTIWHSKTFSTLDDLARLGGELMALATLVHAPVLPQKCLYSGAKRQHPGKNWQCSLQELQRGLHEYPTLLNTFRFLLFGSNARLESGYLQWRKALFFSTSGDTSLFLMSPRWLPNCLRKILHLSIQELDGASFVNPVAWEASVRLNIENEMRSKTSETSSKNAEQYLLRGCSLAAFRYIVALRADAGKLGDFSALDKPEEELLKVVIPLAIRNFKNRVITAACSFLLELCGVSATRLRTDVSVLRRISHHDVQNGSDISANLASILAEEYMQKVLGSDIEKKTAALVLEHLERASIESVSDANGCGLWLKNGEGDGQRIRTSQMLTSECWSLVTTFCRVHHLPTSTVYLAYLARDNDWVGFLAEAQAEACPLDVLLAVTSNFSDEHLRSHITTVLKSLSLENENNDVAQKKLRGDLFPLLAEAEWSKAPGMELLRKAKELRWALLTVVATCFQDVTPLACLATWLEVTAERQMNGIASQLAASVGAAVDGTNSASQGDCLLPVYARNDAKRRRLSLSEREDFTVTADSSAKVYHPDEGTSQPADIGNHESLSKMVAVLCEQQRFIPLLRAFELFLPTSPLLHFIRFLRAFSQMRLSEASSHLGDFSTFLREEIQSRGARTGTTWISKAAVAGADAMIAACPSAYEKRCMLQLLASADFGDGGLAAMGYRKLFWKIQLAEPLLRQDRSSTMHAPDLDDEALLSDLEKNGQWEDARSWARQLDLNQQGSSFVHHVTEMQAEAMVTEWKELLWDVPEQRAALWRHCQSLFTKHLYPPLKAGLFFLKHAEDIEQNGLAAELHAVLLLALQWLSGSITGSAPVYPVHLLRELETRVWLLAVESEVLIKTSTLSIPSYRLGALNNLESSFSMHNNNVGPVDRTAAKIAAVDGHLKVFKSMHMDLVEDVKQVKPLQKEGMPKPKRRLVRRIYNSLDKEQASMDTNDRRLIEEDVSAGWEEKVGEGEVERAILALVEVGQVSAARQLQQKLLPNRVPSELVLAETVYSIAMLSSPTVKGSIRGSLLGANVMKTLNSLNVLKDLSSASPMQVMEALTAASREGCGRGHCKRVTAVAQVANFLDLPFFEAFQKQPTELLQLLSLKGQDALSEAKLLVATHSINPASIARILAESFLKGLLAAHRGGYMDSSSSSREEGPAPLLWRSSDFVQWGQLCPSEPELGHALMRLVISGHDMPHSCEVELLILAHQFYESSGCLDGMDVLVALAATRVESYVSEGDFAALARLVTGVSNFQALRFVLDLLIENGQLELLLKKRANVEATKESSASVRGFRMAVLSALRHFNPHDLDAFGMVYSHFSMAHEMANLLESRGRKGLNHWFIRNDPDQNEELLDIMRFFVEASEVYAGIDCGNKTRWCCAQASVLSLQLRMPELVWLNLTETNARRLLVDQRRFQEALIVAEAYNLNQPAEWVPVLWNQVLSPGWIEHFLSEFVASLPLRSSMLMELARIYRSEVSARGDHLDFSKWLTSGMPPEITKSFRCILKHVGDFRLRTQLTTLASGFPDVLDVCARILDKVPDTAGPLVLRRGHGQVYVPLM